jgi:dolichyl-phosphate-mannose--protein O-mannosyl transferase
VTPASRPGLPVDDDIAAVEDGADLREMEGLSRTASGDPVPTARERARPLARLEDPVIGWTAAIAVTLLAFFLRVWKLGTPREFEFDETYYAKDAWSMLNHGYVREYVENANDRILDGRTTSGLWEQNPSMVVHPEAGKWMIALGEKAFGMDPFGWRIAAAVVGSLMVLVMCRLVRRLTGSTLLGCVAGLLLCLDGMHLVLSRLALLDVFLAFFLLCAAACLVLDRDWTRARLTTRPGGSWGPTLWFRPWLALAGVCFGLAIGTKWSAAYALAAFGVLVWLWNAGARRSIGVRLPVLRSALLDGVPAFVHLVLVAFVVYVATWTGWLVHAHEYEQHLSSTQYTRFASATGECKKGDPVISYDESKRWPTATEPDASGPGEILQSLRSLWYYHHDVYVFHRYFLSCSTHVYQSDPGGWLVLQRPVGVNVENDIKPGSQGCDAPADSSCLREVLLIGTPAIWWGGALALVYAVFAWVLRRDWRYGFALVGALSMWLPWQLNDDRPIFLFYASAILPFTIIALTLALGAVLGSDRTPSARRTVGTILAGSYLVLVLLNFAWFWPIWTDGLLTRSEWLDRIWFRRWI